MCTLIALHRCADDAPLVVAANRDEQLGRPSQGFVSWRLAGRTVLAPRDLQAGGTWHGLADSGLFAAVTNRPVSRRDPSRRSRGLLVLDALGEPDAAGAVRRLQALPDNTYNPFNLFLSDGREAFVVVYEDKPSVMELSPGPHLVGNADPDDRSVPKVRRLLAAAEAVAARPPATWLDGLAEICRGHDGEGSPLEPACIHADGYGTRSSTLLRLARTREQSVLRHAEGPPCETAYRDHHELLDGLPLWRGDRTGGTTERTGN